MKEFGYSYDKNGDPILSDCTKINFATYYSTPESVSAFDRLYSNTDGLQDKFMAYWDTLAKHF